MSEADFDPRYTGKVQDGRAYPGRLSRFAQLAKNNLGIVEGSGGSGRPMLFRDAMIDLYDKYYEGCQYEHLQAWDAACCSDDYVAIRKRRPRINYNFGKMLASRIASKLVGDSNYPAVSVEEDPDTTEYLKIIQKVSMLRPRLLEPVRRLVAVGSVFVRYQIIGQAIKVEWYNSKFCYPVLGPNGELDSIEIKYVYEDPNDIDPTTKKPKCKWFRMELGKVTDILYDNPEFKPGAQSVPIFEVDESVTHNLGFVQGTWMRTTEEKFSPDGYGIISDLTDFIDEMNYNLSQSSQSVSYNQEPQTLISGIDEEEMSNLIRSSSKAWNLGKDGKASLMESGMAGTKAASDLRDKVRLGIQDISRVVLLDPEKMAAQAQSGRAMEVMHGPFVELLHELRPMVEKGLRELILKMAVTVLMIHERGEEDAPITIPEGYRPQSLDIKMDWPPVFPLTMNDLKEMVGVVTAATAGNVLSREWGTRWLAKVKEFGIDDVEAELQRVATQPVINPFGAF